MAFFSSKKNKENIAQKSVADTAKVAKAKAPKKVAEKAVKTAETKAVAKAVKAPSAGVSFDLSHNLASMIIKPRVTEKATVSAESGVYVFEVSKDSTKDRIAKAIAAMYKVTPVKVRTVVLPAKSVFVRGKWGSKTGVKKAYVYLKKGDKIEII